MIVHILKDGIRLKDITGHVVKTKDADAVYHLIHKINNKGRLKL